jgi:hypothetical protein
MANSPVLSLTDPNNIVLNTLNFGVVDAGNLTGGIKVRIFNNLANAAGISDALNPTITTKTYNGEDSGDSVSNGNEIVVNQMIQVQCTSAGETAYSPIGGPNVHSIADSPPQSGNLAPLPTIHAYNDSSTNTNNYAELLLRAQVPPSATAGNISFLIRCSFQYQ